MRVTPELDNGRKVVMNRPLAIQLSPTHFQKGEREMRNPKYPLLALVAYLALIGVLAISTARPGHTQGGKPPGPDVRVINKTTEPVPVTLQGSAQIDTSSPIPVRDVDQAAKQPVQIRLSVFSSLTYTVPAKKQLVIEFASGFFVPHVGLAETGLIVHFGDPAQAMFVSFAPTPTHYTAGVPDRFVYSQACRIFANPGSEVKVSGGESQSVVLSGYLVDTQ
jgi:hypothetical protein